MSVELSLPQKIVHPTNKIENNDFQSQSGYANTNMMIKLPYEGMSWLSRWIKFGRTFSQQTKHMRQKQKSFYLKCSKKTMQSGTI